MRLQEPLPSAAWSIPDNTYTVGCYYEPEHTYAYWRLTDKTIML